MYFFYSTFWLFFVVSWFNWFRLIYGFYTLFNFVAYGRFFDKPKITVFNSNLLRISSQWISSSLAICSIAMAIAICSILLILYYAYEKEIVKKGANQMERGNRRFCLNVLFYAKVEGAVLGQPHYITFNNFLLHEPNQTWK